MSDLGIKEKARFSINNPQSVVFLSILIPKRECAQSDGIRITAVGMTAREDKKT